VSALRWLGIAFLLTAPPACGISLGDGDSPLYDGPWPDERLRQADGTVDVSEFPRGTGVPLREQLLEGLEHARGFGLASAIYFPMSADLDESTLPSLEASVEPSSSVALIDVDPSSPELGRRIPVDVRFNGEAAPFAPARVLSLLPHPGIMLRPETLYAGVVTARVRDVDGGRPASSGIDRSPLHVEVAARLGELGIDDLLELAVFRTGPDPAEQLRRDLESAVRRHLPTPEAAPRLIEQHPEYCVFETSVRMPAYQAGRPPYLFEGGQWVRDPNGELALQHDEPARVFLTVPRITSDGPYPTAVLIRTGAGGDRPLIDRGPRDASGQSTPGTGLAVHLARAGYVGVSVDGPLGGVRNVAGWDEQFAVFNVVNMAALRDNVRHSALELGLLAHVLEDLHVDASECEGASPEVRTSGSRLALIGHSMGATIAPLVAAIEPRYGAMILSGAGASWVRQILYKQSPFETRPMAELMLGYALHQHALSEHDPMLSLLQWGGEAADPQIYGRAIAERADPPHVLVFQGLLDSYIPPPIANPLNLSLELDLAGEALDESYPEYRPYIADEALGRQRQLDYPVQGNGRDGVTRVLAQHAEDGIEDGHEVLFQLPAAQRQLRCFLETFTAGTPVVVAPDTSGPCVDPANVSAR
jgi:hypothetical protein